MNLELDYINEYKNKSIQQISSGANIMVITVNEKERKVFEKFILNTYGERRKAIPLKELLSGMKNFASTGISNKFNNNAKNLPVLNIDLTQNEKHIELSKREKEVLSALSLGKRYKQIADLLFISVHTVRFHIKSIYRKFNVHSQLEALAIASKIGLI